MTHKIILLTLDNTHTLMIVLRPINIDTGHALFHIQGEGRREAVKFSTYVCVKANMMYGPHPPGRREN